jgi:ABC-type Fe3+/spermidine/putrescine transport system ATPase subunit
MIEIRGLVAHYGSFSLQEIDLTIEEGECFVLLGPSGAGKTLCLETILGIKPPDHGTIHLDGRDIGHAEPETRGFSYLPQDLALFPHLSVWKNIAFGLFIRRTAAGVIEERLRRVADLLGIEHLLGRRSIRGLSGGEQQRVALARALVVEPRVLFLDEPFSALDPATRRQLQREFHDIRERLGITSLLVTHDHEEAAVLADRMGVIMGGKLQQVGTPADVFDRPVDLATARFMVVENLYDGVADSAAGTVRCGSIVFQAPTPRGGPCSVGIRARFVGVLPATAEAGPSRHRGTLEAVVGSFAAPRAVVRLDDTICVECGPFNDRDVIPAAPGEELIVELPPERFVFFPGSKGASQ